jgi:hypothetical protein
VIRAADAAAKSGHFSELRAIFRQSDTIAKRNLANAKAVGFNVCANGS